MGQAVGQGHMLFLSWQMDLPLMGVIRLVTGCWAECAGDTFYVIAEGAFSVFDNSNVELVRIGKGSCFGELALLRQVAPSLSPTTQAHFAGAVASLGRVTLGGPCHGCCPRAHQPTLRCASAFPTCQGS